MVFVMFSPEGLWRTTLACGAPTDSSDATVC
jgi:hypothetical protein